MKIYNFLSRIGVVRRNYALKFFFVAIPFIVLGFIELLLFIGITNEAIALPLPVMVIAMLLLTIALAALTLYLFNKLLTPLRHSQQILDNYIVSGQVPDQVPAYEDEAGRLLSTIQSTIKKLDGLIVEKSDMVDLLSHDVRSPVGRILSLSMLIKIDEETDKDLYANYIANECNGLLSMLENILLILKEDSHIFTLTNVNLNKLIQEALTFFSFAVAEKKLIMDVNIDEHIYINVQEQLFKQAVRNIIGNAIKFSPEGKVIKITGAQTSEQVSLTIKDQGLGFKPNDIKRIFERFTSAGKKGTHGEASTGLGLYLSKKIVEKHGGKLMAESDGENKGASFTFLFYKRIIKKPQDKVIKRAPPKSVLAFRGR